MNNLENSVLTMRNILLDADIIDHCDIAFIGREFDPSNKDLWIRESLNPLDGSEFSNCLSQSSFIYTLGVFVGKGQGTENLYDMMEKLREIYLVRSDPYTYNDVESSIIKVETSQLVVYQEWQHINFNIYFQGVEIL